MKKIKIEKTNIAESKVRFQGDKNRFLNYADLIELALDIVPQGGFTPSAIKERNRIQEAIDQSDSKVIQLEDADYEALERIMKDSRWTIRDKELNSFLQNFENGFYKRPEKP
jgi:hypothetical protein